MLVLVTGAGGFAGRYLSLELQAAGHDVLAFDRQFAIPMPGVKEELTGDVCDAATVSDFVEQLAPDACIHLAALASVPAGQEDPAPMLAVNIAGTMNILEAFRRQAVEARILVVSTAHIYEGLRTHEPLDESVSPAPLSIYAVSKAAADLATLAYAQSHGLQAMTVRPNNHTGPGQTPAYVVPAFARQVKAIAAGIAPASLSVGNLESIRDFLDVRDVVRAYRLVLEKGKPGQAYNVASGNRKRMGDILQELCDGAGIAPDIQIDPDKFRPTDEARHLSTMRIEADTGWRPEIEFSQTLKDMLDSA